MVDVRTFISDELCYDHVKKNEDGVLDYLYSLTTEDIDKIEKQIMEDDELNDKINEITNWYVYHYRKWGNNENK